MAIEWLCEQISLRKKFIPSGDLELAEIYGYETKRLNEQVKNNIEKFDDDFRFQLTKVEWENLRSKITTSNSEMGPGGRRYLQHSKKRPQQKLQALPGSF